MIKSNGFIAISTVVIILAVILGLTIVMSYAAIGEAQSGLAIFQGEENLQQVEGCVEDALLKARSNPAFGEPVLTPVNINRPPPQPNCVVTVLSKSGSGTVTWDMEVTLDTTIHKRTINVDFTRSPTQITLTGWNEI